MCNRGSTNPLVNSNDYTKGDSHNKGINLSALCVHLLLSPLASESGPSLPSASWKLEIGAVSNLQKQ